MVTSFRAAMAVFQDEPTEEEWRAASRAYARLKDSLSEDAWAELWAKVKQAQVAVRFGSRDAEANPYLVFDRYARIRTRRYQATVEYREKRREYQKRPEVQAKDRARATDPKRKEQIRAAKQRHRMKKKAQQGAKEK